MKISWQLARFDDLLPRDIHDLYRARIGVFVLEQKCIFQDVDGVDPLCWHLIGRAEKTGVGNGFLAAYCRLVPPGVKYAEPSMGRVLTTAGARGTGAGRELMRESLRHAQALWPTHGIRIGAQHYLERFYRGYGFATVSEPYDDDGVPHIEMLRPAPSARSA